MVGLTQEFKPITTDELGKTGLLKHDAKVTSENPIRCHPYRLNPTKLAVVRSEVKYTLGKGIKRKKKRRKIEKEKKKSRKRPKTKGRKRQRKRKGKDNTAADALSRS